MWSNLSDQCRLCVCSVVVHSSRLPVEGMPYRHVHRVYTPDLGLRGCTVSLDGSCVVKCSVV